MPDGLVTVSPPPATETELGDMLSRLFAKYQEERSRLDMIALYAKGQQGAVYLPRDASLEYRLLVEMSKFNVMSIVVNSLAQQLFVDGFVPTGGTGRAASRDSTTLWDHLWQPNRMDARQATVYRTAIRYGYSFMQLLPGVGPDGSDLPKATPYSPRQVTAVYEDELNDEWPLFYMVLEQVPAPLHFDSGSGRDPLQMSVNIWGDGARLKIVDGNYVYRLVRRGGDWLVDNDGISFHGVGIPPLVRFLDEMDCEQLPEGKIAPVIPAQRQLNQTTFSLLMAQQYAAFPQRWWTGGEIEEDENGVAKEPFRASVDRIFHTEDENARFGDFTPTDLKGYLDSREKLLLYVASISQLPVQYFVVGHGISNISAEALVALQDTHRHDIAEHKTSFGEGVEQFFRLGSLVLGNRDGWLDRSAQVRWRDTTPRSLGQVADALGKFAQMLDVPKRALWEHLPLDITEQDLERFAEMAEEEQLLESLAAQVSEEEANAFAGDAVLDEAA